VATPDGSGSINKLGDPTPSGAGVKRLGKRAAAALIQSELTQMRALYTGADTILMMQMETMTQSMAVMQEQMKDLLDGQDPVQLFIQSVNNVLDKLQTEMTNVTHMKELATTTEERGKMIKEDATSAISKVDTISIPALKPKPPAADASVLDEAAEYMRQHVANRVIAEINERVNGAKADMKRPLVEIRDHATELAEFSKVLQDITIKAIEQIQEQITKFQGRLAQAKTFPDLFNVAMRTVTEALGIEGGIDMNDVLAEWHTVGPMLDTADQLVATMASAPEEGDGAGGPSMAPAQPPPDQ